MTAALPPCAKGRFWDDLGAHAGQVALIEGERALTYAELASAVDEQKSRLRAGGRKLVFLAMDRNMQSVICYLALLGAGHAVFLCGELDRNVVETYRPDMILSPPGMGQALSSENYKPAGTALSHEILVRKAAPGPLHADLCLLLSTSGSTGAAKLARLSYGNVTAAAEQVREALRITSADRAITSIPLDHVYGLSILHGQLAAGGATVLSGKSALSKEFWNDMCRKNISILGGVPWTYKTMKDAGMTPDDLPALRKIHQSGAKLDCATADWLREAFPRRGIELYFMYGQTEAGGRICVLPPELAKTKTDSIGRPVSGGRINLAGNGEIVYSGPNVMLGYARRRQDLCRGDDLKGILHTGDLGRSDTDGCFYLTGRQSRVCKILGNRINLDDLEIQFPKFAVTGDDTLLTLYSEEPLSETVAACADMLASRLRIPRRSIILRHVEAFPRSAAGKISYDKLPNAVIQSSFRGQ